MEEFLKNDVCQNIAEKKNNVWTCRTFYIMSLYIDLKSVGHDYELELLCWCSLQISR